MLAKTKPVLCGKEQYTSFLIAQIWAGALSWASQERAARSPKFAFSLRSGVVRAKSRSPPLLFFLEVVRKNDGVRTSAYASTVLRCDAKEADFDEVDPYLDRLDDSLLALIVEGS